MKHTVKNQRGLTLIEILATLVLCGILAIIIFNIQNHSSKQYNNQVTENSQIQKASYLLKVITAEIRKYPLITDVIDTTEEIKDGQTIYKGIKIGNNEYKFDNHVIYLNGKPFASEIEDFYIQEDGGRLTLYIENTQKKIVSTSIVPRSGNE